MNNGITKVYVEFKDMLSLIIGEDLESAQTKRGIIIDRYSVDGDCWYLIKGDDNNTYHALPRYCKVLLYHTRK